MHEDRAPVLRPRGPRIIQPILRSKGQTLSLSSGSLLVPNSGDGLRLEASASNQIIKTHNLIKTPKSETCEQLPLLHSVSSMVFELNESVMFSVEPRIMNVSRGIAMEVFLDKCRQCLQVCDFTSDSGQTSEKRDKSEILADILAAVSDPELVSMMSEKEYISLYRMFRRNVIRTTPKPLDIWFAPVQMDFSLDRVEEVGWVHLEACYSILIALFSNKRVNTSFCTGELSRLLEGLVSMFQSPDNRERAMLMKLLHTMYRTLKKMRGDIRRLISSFLLSHLNVPYPQLGVAEMLNAIVPIIAGLKVPLHDENTDFFENVLVLLHRCSDVALFHTSLVNAIMAFLTKNERLVYKTIKVILDHWPKTAPTTQILFLNEIESFADMFHPDILAVELLEQMCHTIAACITTEHFAVSERALMLWESDSFMVLIGGMARITYPILIPSIYKTATTHWCGDVKALALNAMRVLKGCDIQVFNEIGVDFKKAESDRVLAEMRRGSIWKRLIDEFSESLESKQEQQRRLASLYIGCEGFSDTDNPGSLAIAALTTANDLSLSARPTPLRKGKAFRYSMVEVGKLSGRDTSSPTRR